MSKIKNTILVVLLTSFVICQKTYIHAGRLIDGITEIPIEMVTIVINGNTIQSIFGTSTPSVKHLALVISELGDDANS